LLSIANFQFHKKTLAFPLKKWYPLKDAIHQRSEVNVTTFQNQPATPHRPALYFPFVFDFPLMCKPRVCTFFMRITKAAAPIPAGEAEET
ncbi:MAG: hypothetical protein FWG38_03855, partial [Defluviitaleaceae bacterium]|nr:hypothetical protein [Defluviitaleaceae bacterium]